MYIWLTIVLVVVLDRISKLLVVNNLDIGESLEIIPGFFYLTYIRNPGAAFGMLAGKQWFFVLIAVIVMAAIIYFQRSISKELKAIRVCLGLIGGGALGNLIDRVFSGEVVDFLDFRVWSYIFNIADSAIVVGGFLLVLLIYKQERTQGENNGTG